MTWEGTLRLPSNQQLFLRLGDNAICGYELISTCEYSPEKRKLNPRHQIHTITIVRVPIFLVTCLDTHRWTFAAGASSQANDSLNATMTSHYPKSRCYSQTASGDFRFGCAIGKKNLGERYIQEAATKRLLSPGFHTNKYVNRRKKNSKTTICKSEVS
ncbi:Protein of unknown function [Cotesia congregata]|uniref:Uncharacterized protein n=1 Tax=Cotesia congregata TaxID=51543 RepID=A0A8J2N0S9_COTCN|nr:Protein of unknown function [Cotesia congregata]